MSSVLLVWALSLAAWDLRHRRLPNLLTLGAFGLGLAVLFGTGESLLGQPAVSAWQALGLALLLTLPAHVLGLLGAGDVKLAAAVAVMSGLAGFLMVYALAALLAVGFMLAGRFTAGLPYLHGACPAAPLQARDQAGRGTRQVPYGAALGLALAVVLVAGLS